MSLLLLGVVTFGEHFAQDIARAIFIAHIDIGSSEVQFGAGAIAFFIEIEIGFVFLFADFVFADCPIADFKVVEGKTVFDSGFRF